MTKKKPAKTMSLHDRVEFALRDAGFDLDEASRIAILAATLEHEPIDSYKVIRQAIEVVDRAISDDDKDARKHWNDITDRLKVVMAQDYEKAVETATWLANYKDLDQHSPESSAALGYACKLILDLMCFEPVN